MDKPTAPVTRRLLPSRTALACACLSWLLAADSGHCLPGYLAVVGPAPLRFAKPPKIPDAKFNLPMPPPLANQPDLSDLISKIPPLNPPPPAPVRTVVQPVVVVQPPGQPQAPLAPAVQDGVVSAQMLLKYFDKASTNAAPGGAVVAPLEFNPPQMAPPPNQSSASFSTGP